MKRFVIAMLIICLTACSAQVGPDDRGIGGTGIQTVAEADLN